MTQEELRRKLQQQNNTNAPGFPWLQTNTKGINEVPQFVGMDLKQKIDFIRAFIKDQVKSRGFRHDVANGTNQPFKIELSGVAKMMLGFSVFYETPALASIPTSISLVVNDESIISDVSPYFFGENFTDSEYFWFPRPLSGSDVISWEVLGQATNVEHLVFYYL